MDLWGKKRKQLKCVVKTGRPVMHQRNEYLLTSVTDTVDLILLLVNDNDIIQLEHHHVFFARRENNSNTLILLYS